MRVDVIMIKGAVLVLLKDEQKFLTCDYRVKNEHETGNTVPCEIVGVCE